MRILLTILLLSFSMHSYGFEFEGGTIKIPHNFEGPITKNLGPQGKAYGFRNLHKDRQNATLLQITVLDPGKKFPPLSEQQLKEGASHYLLNMLSGVERRRTEFKKSKIEHIKISGIPTAKIHWSGYVSNQKAEGIMYCYIYNSRVISLHTQDLKKYSDKYLNQAAKAFETIRIKN